MKRAAGLIAVALPWIAAAPAAAQGAPSCSASEVVGWITRIEGGARRSNTPSPVIRRGSAEQNAAEGARLCAGDVVRNPAGSARRVRLRTFGGDRYVVEPGTNHAIPQPNSWAIWWQRVRGLMPTFDRLGSTRSTASYSRAPLCRYEPVSLETESVAVAAWGPLTLSWSCQGDESGPYEVVIASGGRRDSQEVDSNLVQIDPVRCQPECMIIVTRLPQRVPQRVFRVRTVPAAALPRLPQEVERLEDMPRAAIGAWLADQPRAGWRLQGMSLLWNAACEVPAAAIAAMEQYGAPSPRDACPD